MEGARLIDESRDPSASQTIATIPPIEHRRSDLTLRLYELHGSSAARFANTGRAGGSTRALAGYARS